MKYEFRIDQDKASKLVIMAENDLEKQLINLIFGKGDVKVDLVTNKDEVSISSKKKEKNDTIS